MDGLVYTIDVQGRALAEAEQRIAALQAENAILREQLAPRDDGADGAGAPVPA